MVRKFAPNRPPVAPYAECPSCHQLINLKSFTDAHLVGARNCPFCGRLIEKKQIIASAEIYARTIRAVQTGRDVLGFNRAILIIFGMIFLQMALLYYSKYLFGLSVIFVLVFSILLFLGGSLKIENWLSEYGLIESNEEDYLTVREKIRRSRKLWLLANVVNLGLWLIFIKFF